MDPAYALADAALLAQCEVACFRSHGPGGQHANRTESAVRLVHRPSGVTSQCQDHRQRGRNQQDALRRLRVRLAAALRGQARGEWLDPYRRGRQLGLGARAEDFPLAVAVALDALEAAAGSLAEAARATGLSSSQFAKLLCADKEVHQAANQLRERFAQGPIRG
jgi:protein subunit release factor B